LRGVSPNKIVLFA